MTYQHTPCGIATGQPSVIRFDLQAGFCEPEKTYLDGPLDAVEFVPAGSVVYSDWGPKWPIQPHHQQQTFTWRWA